MSVPYTNPPPVAPVMVDVTPLPPPIQYTPPAPLDEQQLNRLVEQGFTRGLAHSLNGSNRAFLLRIWIVDNSGSMQKTDGHRMVTNKKRSVTLVECTRWEEIRDCVQYHIQLAHDIRAPTQFRLLNDPGPAESPPQFAVAESPDQAPGDYQDALSYMAKIRPGGCTPLTHHLQEVYAIVDSLQDVLRATGQKVAIVIATDGLPTNDMGYEGPEYRRAFVEALRRFESLPVWVVIRLCTDEDDVVDFYNELDAQLELSMEVLDDFVGEAKEVHETNPWLNYALPLHRLREMGYHDRVLDMLDERLLTKGELRDFCALLFGPANFDGVPDPSLDWPGFLKEIQRLLQQEKPQWDPIKGKLKPWLDLKSLNSLYGDGSCTIL